MAEPSTSATVTAAETTRREADPLPPKVGEFGYVAPTLSRDGQGEMREVNLNDGPSLPARHPADRDQPTSPAPAPSSSNTSNTSNTVRPRDSDGASTIPKKGLSAVKWGGISLVTFVRIGLIMLLLAGTGVGWWITVEKFSRTTMENRPAFPDLGNNGDNDNDNQNSNEGDSARTNQVQFPFSTVIFVHIAFTVIAVFELLFLERAVFHARAERYIYKNGLSPRAMTNAAVLGIAPWNRPPLPTYAAALAESGVGTGDVEDNLIAINPPPAYGNTRGSTLLLSSMLPAGLLRTLSRASERSESSVNTQSQGQGRNRSQESQMEEGNLPRSRPVSYDASEEIDNARRARELEGALARLENGSGGGHRPASPPDNTR